MFLTTTLILCLLPFSLLAAAPKPTGCLPHLHSTLFHTALTFTSTNQPYRYAIVTKYTTYYPPVLRTAMTLIGVPALQLGNEEACGWHKARSAHAGLGIWGTVHAGDVWWKYNDLRWVHESKTWVAIDPTHYPSASGPAPDNATLDAIVRVLEDNVPAGDVYEIATIVLGYAVTLMGFVLLMLAVKSCAERGERTAMPRTWDDEGVELDVIKTYNNAAPNEAGFPVETPKYSYDDNRRASAASTDTLRSEPLPIYSVDGAGR